MNNEEGKRLELFIQRVCKITKREFAKEIGKTSPSITKYINGSLVIPTDVLRYMHKKWQLRYTWFFEGTGSMQGIPSDNKKLMNNLADIMASTSYTEQAVDSLRNELKKLATDFYAFKHGVK